MHVMSAVPGQTGCLATREVPVSSPRRHKKVQILKRVVAQQKVAIVEIDEPHFSGGTRITLTLHLEGGRDRRRFL